MIMGFNMTEIVVKCRPDVATKKIKVFGSYDYSNGTILEMGKSGIVNAAPVPDVIQLQTTDSGTILVFNHSETAQLPKIVLPYDDVPDGAFFEIKTANTYVNWVDRATLLSFTYMRKTGEELRFTIHFADTELIYSEALDLWLVNTTPAVGASLYGTIYDGGGNQTDSFGRFTINGETYNFNQVALLSNGTIVPSAGIYRG